MKRSEPPREDELERLLLQSSPYAERRRNRPTSAFPQTAGRISSTVTRAPSVSPVRASRKVAASLLAVAATTAVVATIAVSQGVLRPESTHPAAPVPTNVVSPAITPDPAPEELESGIIGSGTLVTPDGTTVGDLTIVHEGGQIIFKVADFSLSDLTFTPAVSVDSPSDPRCADNPSHVVGGSVVGSSAFESSLPVREVTHGDPTALKDYRLRAPFTGEDPACTYEAIARASIVWAIEPLRPYLAEVHDRGPRDGASGTVEVHDGVSTYVVAEGDSLTAVADRFELSTNDVFYLNEARSPNPEAADLLVGEQLNLSLSGR